MAAVQQSDMLKALREGRFEKLYYLYGKDVAAIESFTSKLRRKLVKPEDEVCCLHRFDGTQLDISGFEDAAVSLPFFGERVCITVNDFNADAASAELTKRLISALSSLTPMTVVIFYATGTDICAGKKNPTAKNKKLVDFIAKNGAVCDFTQKSVSENAKLIIAYAEKSGCAISRRAAEKIAEKCLCSSLLIASETAKLCAYADKGEITEEAVELLVSRQLDSDAFSLAKAVAAFDGRRAVSLLGELFELKYEPVVILSAISGAFNDLYRARAALDTGRRSDEVAEDFGYRGREFVVNNAIKTCRNIPIKRLRSCMSILAETDLKLKSSRNDKNDRIPAHRILIEQCIARMLCSR